MPKTTKEALLERVIARLNSARDDLEAAAQLEPDIGYRADMKDSADDIGPILLALETMVQWRKDVSNG